MRFSGRTGKNNEEVEKLKVATESAMASGEYEGVETNMSQSTSKLKNNKMEVVYVPVEEIEETEEGYTITCPDGTKLSSRSDYLVLKINLEGNKMFYVPYYTLLHDGVKVLEVRVRDMMTLLENMLMFVLASRKYKENRTEQVYNEELELVSKYERIEIDFGDVSHSHMIELCTLEGILDSLDIDKNMITMVNDVDYTLAVRNLLRSGTGPIIVKGDAEEPMLFTSHALLYIFQTIVTKVNFQIELCEKHAGCIEDFRQVVVESCEFIAGTKWDTLVSKKTVQKVIRTLTKHCSFARHLKRPKEKHIGFLNSNSSGRYVLTRHYEETIKHYGLPDFGKLLKRLKRRNNDDDGLMNATNMRVELMLAWIYSVYKMEWPKSKSYLLDVVVDLSEEGRKPVLRSVLRKVLDYNDIASLIDDASEQVNQIGKMEEVEDSLLPKLGIFGNYLSRRFHVYHFVVSTLCTKSKGLEAKYPLIGVLSSNYKLLHKNMTNAIKPSYFLVDRQYASARMKRQRNMCLRSISDFYEVNSTIYIRAFRLKIAGVESIRLLTDDVMELAALFMKQKEFDELAIERKLRECRNWWGEENTTIPLHSFKRFLDESAIYEPDFKIVEDMAYTASVERYRKKLTPISFPNHFNEEVMFASHAALHVFDSVVFNAYWKIERCKEHEKCLTDYRQKIIETVQKYESNKLILRKDVEDDILTLRSHCSYRKLFAKKLSKSHSFLLGEPSGYIPNSCYTQCCEKYNLPEILTVGNDTVDPRLATTLLRLGWLGLFLGTSGVIVKLLDSINMMVLENHMDSLESVWGRLVADETFALFYQFDPVTEDGQDGDGGSPSPASPEPTTSGIIEEQEPVNHHDNGQIIDDIEDSAPVEVPSPSPSVNENTSINAALSASGPSSKNVVQVAEKTRETRKADKPKISTNKPKHVLPEESPEELALEKAKKKNERLEIEMQKLQTKMDNAKDILKDVREAKEKAEQKANHYESLAKTSESRGQRLNEREKELKQKNKEIEKLKKQLDSQQERLLKAEEIEKKAKDRKKIVEDLRKSNKNLQVQVSTLEKKVASLSENLEAEKEKNDTKQKKMTEEVDKLKSENLNLSSQIRIKEQENAQIKCDADKKYMKFLDINSRLKCEKDHQTQTINELKEQVRKLNVCLISKNAMTPTTSSKDQGPSRNPITSLEELEKIRDNFEQVDKEQIMKNGREMVEQLLHLKNDEETRKFAEAELKNLEKSVEDYLEVLNLNIQIFKISNDASKLLSHSELPKLSQRFMDLYSRLESQQSGIPDSDCVICHLFRYANEETITCHRCQKIYHATCLREWYKQPASCEKCPTCKVVLRDPDEYPVLA